MLYLFFYSIKIDSYFDFLFIILYLWIEMTSKPRRYKTGAQALSPETTDYGAMDGKRRRTKTSRFEFDFLDNEEQRMIQQV